MQFRMTITSCALPLILAGCVTTAQSGPGASGKSVHMTAADYTRIIESDRAMVQAGMAPPVVVTYDIEIAKMGPEAETIMATHDAVRAHAWAKKVNSIMAAKEAAIKQFSVEVVQPRNKAIGSQYGGGSKRNYCIGPMGQNICGGGSAGSGEDSNEPSQDNQWIQEQYDRQQQINGNI